MIISKTPFRISFFGGGTDYPKWFMENEGRVLVATIDKYCYITCRSLPPFFDHDIRVAWSRLENVSNIDDILHPAVRECLRFMGISHGVSITHEGDLPARTGLGSSSSFMVGLLNVLYSYHGRMADKMKLAVDAIHIEQNMIKDNVGCQDQISTAFGGINKIEFSSKGYTVSPIILSRETMSTLEDYMMLFYTGVSRTASEVVDEQLRNMGDRYNEMTQMLSLVDQAESMLVSGNVAGFGHLLGETWRLKRSLSGKISNPLIDGVYETGIKAGALGGKLLGAGGGGFVLFMCPLEKQAAVKEALKNLLYVPVRFDFNGTHIVYYTPDDLKSVRGGAKE